MNARAKQLQPAVEQARQHSEDALAQLAAQQQLLAKAEQQLEELRRYRQEYAAAGDSATTVGPLLNRQKFVKRIAPAPASKLHFGRISRDTPSTTDPSYRPGSTA